MKLIVGLGNPGFEYKNTRHNIGFMFVDFIAEKYNVSIDKKKFDGLYTDLFINNEKVILLKPQSYMNLSGEVVKKYVDFFNIDTNDILIIHDDLDLPCGKFRLRERGSSGGHNGLKNIELNIKTDEYKRIKIGISNNKLIDTKDYVLGKFTKEEEDIINDLKNIVKKIVDDFLNSHIAFQDLMSKYNRK